jgi:hypothetical protein
MNSPPVGGLILTRMQRWIKPVFSCRTAECLLGHDTAIAKGSAGPILIPLLGFADSFQTINNSLSNGWPQPEKGNDGDSCNNQQFSRL